MPGSDNRKKRPLTAGKNIGWMLLFAVIAGASVFTIAAQSKELSPGEFLDYVVTARPGYLLLAVASMLAFVMLEGLAILRICAAMGYRRRLRSGWVYAAADIYFSAITPSATGGQPACGWVMIKDGIPGGAASVALVVNLVFYTFSILLIGLGTFLADPAMFRAFSPLARALILVGYGLLAGLTVLFVLLLFRVNIVRRVCRWGLRLLGKLRLVKAPQRKQEALETVLAQYEACAGLLLRSRGAMVTAFLCNLFQRAAQITVTVFAYLSVGGAPAQGWRVWLVQAYCVVGANCVPIPGAMGVSDYLLLDGFGQLMPGASAVKLELLSRGLAFYSMIVLCGITVLVKYIRVKQEKRKRRGKIGC